jgi:myo-inositol 2-dehydrogenase/D-chiro-inositol 1-dehydrogenase
MTTMTGLDPNSTNSTRRTFLKHSSAAIVGSSLLPGASFAQAGAVGDREIRIALIGCGGRGTGAADQALSTSGKVKLVAVADAFRDRMDGCLEELSSHGDKIDVPEERKFVGFDAYEKAIASDVDMVILTTPPGFRPIHFEHAIAQGKHVFMEKPVAVDGPGIRRVIAAAAVAKEKNLKVGVGLQRHHSKKYIQTIGRIKDGAIGDVTFMRCYWNSGGVWVRERQPSMTEMEYQMRNWYYFNWLCGDHIVEQHIHNLDVCNWIKGEFPVSAQGQGGRQVRTGLDHGEIFDHHMLEYTYADGTKMLSQCRHIKGAWSSVSEHAHGTRGVANVSGGRIESEGGWDWRFSGDNPDAYQVENDDLFAAIRKDTPYNEAVWGAKSTMTAILGRMATYSGQVVSWDDAINSEIALVPAAYAWDANPPSMPDQDGRYPIPTPGMTQSV